MLKVRIPSKNPTGGKKMLNAQAQLEEIQVEHRMLV